MNQGAVSSWTDENTDREDVNVRERKKRKSRKRTRPGKVVRERKPEINPALQRGIRGY